MFHRSIARCAGECAAVQEIGDWLEKLGMPEYGECFAQNKIDLSVLPHLTDQDLKEIGVPLGHRRKMLAAIRELPGESPLAPKTVPTGEAKPQDTAERRQVTVMFSDLVGSTALSGCMDPEDLREIISAYQKCVAETVQRFGGFVAKYMGDGVLVYFGYPQAHEDDAERATRAGLELIQAVGGLKSSTSLQTRVGIATGLVVVGDLIGSGAAQEQTVVGETPNLAARLQGIAEPNMVVIAESTRRLLGNLFDLEDLGAKDLKGITARAHAWAVLRVSSVASRFEALHATGLTALVGREEELELLLRRWSKAKTGEGQVVLLSGEAGIGKSRLTAALLEAIASEPHTRLRYFCSPQHTDSALYPIIGQIARAAKLAHDDTLQAKLDKLDALLAQTSPSKQDAVLIAELLSLPNDGRYTTLGLTPEQRRQKTLQALISQVQALTRSKPTLMIVEDVHWTDPSSLEVFGRVVDRIATLRVLLIVTYRPEFQPPWIGRPHVTALTLNRLTRREINAMIEGVIRNHALPADIRQDIIERTDGIPLFVEEMTKAVLEAESDGDARRIAAAVPSSARAVPASLQASLMARLDRLGPAKEVAQVGAAIGREFSHALLSAVLRKPEADLNSALKRLVDAGLLFRQGVPPNATYLFKHALVQDVAYDTLLRSRRQQLHAGIVTTMESLFPEIVAADPAILARHCSEAGLDEKTVDYRLKAGQQAVARSAMVEAVAQLEKGLGLLATMPSSRGHQQQELDLRLALSVALSATRGYSSPQVAETFSRVSELAEQVDEPSRLFPVLYRQWAYHLVRSEHRLALSFAERIERRGELQNDLTLSLLGHFYHGVSRHYLGEFAAAYALFEQCDNLRDPAVRNAISRMIAEDAYVAMLGYSSSVLGYLGYFDQAQYRADEGLLEARRLRHAHTLAYALSFKMATMVIANMEREIRTYADELFDLSNESGFPFWAGIATFYRGLWSAAEGQARQGVILITQSIDQTQATGAAIFTPRFLAGLAVAFSRLGQPAEGLSRLREAAQFIDRTDERVLEADIRRLQGELLSSTGDVAAAELSYQQALAVARQQQAKCWELRAAMSMARLWRDQGKRDEARDLLAPVYGWFTEGFDTLDLKQAKALLEQLAT